MGMDQRYNKRVDTMSKAPTATEKPRRKARMPEDYGKTAWFRNRATVSWTEGELCGYCHEWVFPWCSADGRGWERCEVECDEPTT
jgi:hypothetical protein